MSHEIIQLKVEDHDNFIYIIADRTTGEAAVVDPAWDAEGILETLAEEELTLTAILLTHSHYDHVNAVQALLNEQVSVFLTVDEEPMWKNCPVDAILLQDGDEIQLGSTSIQVILTAGHTPGACCYRTGNHLLTGDTLFIYGCGRADLAGGDVEKLYDSLQKLKTLPPELNVWVGHDYSICEESTLGEQFSYNPFLMIDNLEDFRRFRLELARKTRQIPYGPMTREELTTILQMA